MICQLCGLPCKSCMADHTIFEFEALFCTTFVSAISWPTSYDGGLRQLTFNDYIIQLIIDLKWNINSYW